MNRLTDLTATVDGALSATAAYHYDAAGRLDRKSYGNADQATNGFDIESRLQDMKLINGTSQLKKFHYVRDTMGNIKTLETYDQPTRFDYDQIDQLTKEILPSCVTSRWEYDEVGNALVMPGLTNCYYYNADGPNKPVPWKLHKLSDRDWDSHRAPR